MQTLLKSIPVVLLLAMGTTSSPLSDGPVVHRSRIYDGPNPQSEVNPSTQQENDPSIGQLQTLRNAGFYIPSGSVVRNSARSGKKEGRRDADFPEYLYSDEDDYFSNPEIKNGKTPSRDWNSPLPLRLSQSRRRPVYRSPNSRGSHNFFIGSGMIPRNSGSWKKEGQHVQDSGEVVHLNAGDDYFDPDFSSSGRKKLSKNHHNIRFREDSNHPKRVANLRKDPSSGLQVEGRQRPVHNPIRNKTRNPTGGGRGGEYGYNYQGGTGDVQIHQHIHEYRFGGEETRGECGSCYSDQQFGILNHY